MPSDSPDLQLIPTIEYRPEAIDKQNRARQEDRLLGPIAIRNATEDDVGYLMSRTLKDLKNADFCKGVPSDVAYLYLHRALEHHLTRDVIRIAYPTAQKGVGNKVLQGDHRFILGYVIAAPSELGLVVHYANTRRTFEGNGVVTEDYRRRGICKTLVKSLMRDYELDNIIYTNRTAQFRYDKAWRERIDRDPQIEHNPWMFYNSFSLPYEWERGVKRKPSQASAFSKSEYQAR